MELRERTTTSRPLSPEEWVAISDGGSLLTAWIMTPRLGQTEALELLGRVTDAIVTAGRRLRHVVLDFSLVRETSSMGLGFCVEVRKQAKGVGAETVVTGLDPHLAELFRTMRIDRLCTLAPDRAALRRVLDR